MDTCFFSSVLGNSQKLDGGAMFGNAPRPIWQKWIAPDELGRIPLACRALLIEYKNQKILFEAGIGAFFDAKMAERFGVQDAQTHLLRANLNALSLKPSDIDFVVLSHLHFDHAGGILPSHSEMQTDGGLLFKNATYITSEIAFERALHPHSRDKASFIPGLTEKLKNAKDLILIKGNETLFDGRLQFLITNGHTPGQLHSQFRGNEKTLLFCGDLIPGSAWVHLPITMGYDRFPELLIDEKQSLYAKSDLKKTLFYFTHDNDFCCAEIQKEESGKYAATNAIVQAQHMAF